VLNLLPVVLIPNLLHLLVVLVVVVVRCAQGADVGGFPIRDQPYNVYITPKSGTSELFKAIRVYGPEDVEAIKQYTQERNAPFGRTTRVSVREYRNPTESQLAADEAQMAETSRRTAEAETLKTLARKNRGNPDAYAALEARYNELTRRRPSSSAVPFDDEK
jgi:hypothetical protein